MLNTQKLLYILPDVAYIAELLPGKKEHSFTIQAFRQINGEFINDEEELLPDNIEKLFTKIEAEAYHLVLPDFLFTNAIIEVKETNENKVKQYIKEELLPKLDITKETHEIETFSLTQYNGTTKVQLTALEKGLLDPIVSSALTHDVTIEHISPLTWTIKAVISLEPSISVLQIGSMLYVAEHYIGVDQCSMSKVEDIADVVDTIKTLKGSQPSIQTVYLLTNSSVEDKLKDQVSKTLPVQQIASAKEDGSEMPVYVKQIIESGMRTLDISDFPVPSFVLPKHPQGKVVLSAAASEDNGVDEVNEELPAPEPPTDSSAEKPEKKEVTEIEDDEEEENEDDDKAELPSSATSLPIAAAGASLAAASIAAMPHSVSAATTGSDDDALTEKIFASPLAVHTNDAMSSEKSVSMSDTHESDPSEVSMSKTDDEGAETETAEPTTGSSVLDDDRTIARLAGKPMENDKEEENGADSETAVVAKPPVIKNKSGGGGLMRMVFVSLVVFALTVAIGIGVGYGVLSLNKGSETAEAPNPVSASPSPIVNSIPTLSPTPVASTSAIVKKDFKVLIVNATTTAGYAGATSKKLQAAGYTQVKAQNAKGEYDPGFFLLLTKEDAGVVSTMSKDSGLDLTYKTGKTTEDPSNLYDAVIVLAK